MKKKTCVITGCSGFTLIELMVTIGIFAILAGIAIPGFSKWLPGYHLKSAARDVFSNMQLARLTAVKENKNCTVTIDADTDSYILERADGTDIKSVSLDDYGSEVQFDGLPGEESASPITFNSRGTTTGSLSDEYYVYLKNNKDTYYRVTITGIGTINLKKRNGSSSSWE